MRDPARPRPLAARGAPRLAVEGARLRYDADGPWILDGVDLRLAPGRRVALVGPSGARQDDACRTPSSAFATWTAAG